MIVSLDKDIAAAVFTPPAYSDGRFDPAQESCLRELGESRPSVVLAFAPKAAGPYLRSAAIVATGGQLVRTVHAQGGRDASFYLPTWLLYYASGIPSRPLVTHVHMQALPANRNFMDALGLKPVIMLRSIPDMLTSYLDMLESDPLSSDNWLNIALPQNYAALDAAAKADFIIDTMAPWYVSYFSTWLAYQREAPQRVLCLDYDSFRDDPAASLEKLLAHSGLPRSRQDCTVALEAMWEDRSNFRFNKGVSGRGGQRFTAEQIGRLHRLLSYYPDLAPLSDRLIPPPSASSGPARSSAAA